MDTPITDRSRILLNMLRFLIFGRYTERHAMRNGRIHSEKERKYTRDITYFAGRYSRVSKFAFGLENVSFDYTTVRTIGRDVREGNIRTDRE